MTALFTMCPCPDTPPGGAEPEPPEECDPLDRILEADPDLAGRLLADDEEIRALALEEAALRLAEVGRDYREGFPGAPCEGKGGSWDKVLDLRDRARRREPLFQAADPGDGDRDGFTADPEYDPEFELTGGHDNGAHFREARAVETHRGVEKALDGRPARRGRMRTAQELARAALEEHRRVEADRKRRARAKKRGEGE